MSTTIVFCPLDWTLLHKNKELTTQGLRLMSRQTSIPASSLINLLTIWD